MGAVRVKVDLLGIPELVDALDVFRQSLVNRVVKNGATKGARKTVPAVKSALAKNKRTGQLSKSIGVKYAGYRSGWTVLLGPRRFFRAQTQLHGTVNPAKTAHLPEGGRKEVFPTSGRPMPIFVRKLDARRIRNVTAFKRKGGTIINDKSGRARKVPGGWLLFSWGAKRAPAFDWLKGRRQEYGDNIKNAVVNEIQTELPRLAAQAVARGKNPYRS